MRLLHSCQSLSRSFGGVFEAVRQLVSEQVLISQGMVVRVIGASDAHREADRVTWPEGMTEDYTVSGPRSFGWSSEINSLYRQFHPDLVQVHGLWMYYGLCNSRLCRKSRIPYLVSPHGMLDAWALKNSAWKKSLVRRLFEDRHLARAACLHALCAEEAAGIRQLGIATPICVIPNGVQLPLVQNTVSPPWADQVTTGDRVLLFLGRIHPKKGLDNLVLAWKKVCQLPAGTVQGRWKLVIAGWGEANYVTRLRAAVNELGLNKDVLFTGPIFGDMKASALSRAGAFILPSFSEGLPMAVLEAWSHRLPVLMTPECNLKIGFGRGAAVPLGTTTDSLLQPMMAFLQQPEALQKAMGENGYQLTAERFTWSRIALDFQRVYQWILGQGPRPDELMYE